LPRRQREILWLRFEQDLEQREIGERVGTSQMHVSRLLRHSLDTPRASMTGLDGRIAQSSMPSGATGVSGRVIRG
jgi:RNA polymerase sigma-B factor